MTINSFGTTSNSYWPTAQTSWHGSVSRRAVQPELKFRAPDPTSKSFWLRLQNNLVYWKLKPLYYLYNWLAPHTIYVCWAGTHVSGSTIHIFLAPAPAIQSCLGSGSGFRLHSPGVQCSTDQAEKCKVEHMLLLVEWLNTGVFGLE